MGNEAGQLKTLAGLTDWQVYYVAPGAQTLVERPVEHQQRPDPPAAPAPATRSRQLPVAVRIVLSFDGSSGLAGTITRDIALDAHDDATFPQRQRGAALLVALIIVTVVSTLAVSMVWQQWRAVQIEAAERSRQQSAWLLGGAMGWTRDILRGDVPRRPWQQGQGVRPPRRGLGAPLAETRISTFLAADKENTDDAPEALPVRPHRG